MLYWQSWVAPEEAVEVEGVNENSEYQSSAVLWVSAVALQRPSYSFSSSGLPHTPLSLPNILALRVYFEE